jgi:hypothetical protein
MANCALEDRLYFTQSLSVIIGQYGSVKVLIPLAPLKKGGKSLKVPLFKGDLGGSPKIGLY